MVGLETDNRNVFPNDRIGFPHSLLARLCRDDAGAGLKAKKKISARPAVVPRGSGRSFVASDCSQAISHLIRLDYSQKLVSELIITIYAPRWSLI